MVPNYALAPVEIACRLLWIYLHRFTDEEK